MKFTTPFTAPAYVGESIGCSKGPFVAWATLIIDDCPDKPDQRCDGFWPSLAPNDPGYIGDGKTVSDHNDAMAKAEAVMKAFDAGEWFYVGVRVAVSLQRDGYDEISLGEARLYGVECNYPGSDNSYMLVVANELLREALGYAKEALGEIKALEAPIVTEYEVNSFEICVEGFERLRSNDELILVTSVEKGMRATEIGAALNVGIQACDRGAAFDYDAARKCVAEFVLAHGDALERECASLPDHRPDDETFVALFVYVQ
jgi:hypothetical protein